MNVAVDLDGTLAHWRGRWHVDGERSVVGDWIDGAQEALRTLLERGDRVVVHTCRTTWEEGGSTGAVVAFLESGGFRTRLVYGREMRATHDTSDDLLPTEVGVWVGVGKPIAHLYVDDRAVLFDGDWPATLGRMDAFGRASFPVKTVSSDSAR